MQCSSGLFGRMFTECNRLASAKFMLWLLLVLGTGCAVRQKGLIFVEAGTAYLESVQRERWALKAEDDVQGLSRLDGHLLEVVGRRTGRTIRVSQYTVLEGTHGLAHWVGTIVRNRGNLGLLDVEGSQFRPIVGDQLSALYENIGSLVILEGYIERAGEVRVVYYRILEDSEEKP